MFKYIVLICLLALSLYSDLKEAKIRNIYTIFAMIAGILINIAISGTTGLAYSAKGIVLPIMSLGIFFYARLIGAGDIKLFAAIGALFGWKFILYVMAYTFISAGIMAIISLIKKAQLKSVFISFYQEVKICFFTNSILNFQNRSVVHTIKLSPSIVMGIVIQLLLG